MRLLTLRAARHDGDVEAVFLVGAVGDRLVEAAVLGLGHPVGAERDLVQRLSGRWGHRGDHKGASIRRALCSTTCLARDIGCSFALGPRQ